MIHVFSLHRLFLLASETPKQLSTSYSVYPFNSLAEAKKTMSKTLFDTHSKNYCYVYPNIDELFEVFRSFFKTIEAAGGLVKNKQQEYLFIFRNGKWDLPKGKIEKGESIENGAIREVEEECGISPLQIKRTLAPTYHIYSLEEKNILKPTYWFEMLYKGHQVLTPQTEEGITKAEWVSKNNFDKIKQNTFPSILKVLEAI
jgi:8-oxo-dGTP pyrophosphatase MutT (NUDIX family)